MGIERRLGKTVDWTLILLYLLLVLTGLLNIYASIHSTESSGFMDLASRSGRQLLWAGISLAIGAVILFIINPRIWEVLASPAYFTVLVLLVAVIFIGAEHKGSHSWFSVGGVSFQPAEISKITTSLLLAAVMSRQNFSLSGRRNLAAVAFILGVPMLVILAENETGTMMVYLGFLFVLYREGLPGMVLALLALVAALCIITLKTSQWWALAFLLASGAVALWYLLRHTRPMSRERRFSLRIFGAVIIALAALVFSTEFAFTHILQEHQRLRIEVLLGTKVDPKGVGYNVHQSLIAIGSGGLFGKGFLQGTQTTFGFVPEQSTDFIFCTIGEEWGFAGCLVVLVLYGMLISRILADSEQSREAFTRIYGYCLASCLFMHLAINVGMTIGLMPVIGIPLPFISYGGSSLCAFTVMLFIFIALHRQEKKYF